MITLIKYTDKELIPKINYLELWKDFVNHDFDKIIHKENVEIYEDTKWNYIIRYIIETTCDFKFATLVINDKYELKNFFEKYKCLKKINVKNVKVNKKERENIINTNLYKHFEKYFNYKGLFIKLLLLTNSTVKYITINKNDLDNMYKYLIQLNLLNINYHKFDIIDNKYIKIYNYEYTVFNEKMIKNIDTKLLLYLFITDLININNLIIIDENVELLLPYFNTKFNFNNIKLYKTIFDELCLREDLKKYMDEFKCVNLNIKQLEAINYLEKNI